MTAPIAGKRGFALILVLWVSVALAALALIIGSRSTQDVRETRNFVDAAAARHLVEGGVHLAIDALHRNNLALTANEDGLSVLVQPLADADLHVEILNETGRVDINYAGEDLLRAAFAAGSADTELAEKWLAAIKTRRGENESTEPDRNNAVAANSADTQDQIQQALFRDVSELRLLPGMTAGTWERIQPYLTTWAGIAGIHPRFADRRLLAALPNLSPEDLDRILAWRKEAAGRTEIPPPPVLSSETDFFSEGHSRAFRITARVDGARYPALRLQTVVIMADGAPAPKLVEWREVPAGG